MSWKSLIAAGSVAVAIALAGPAPASAEPFKLDGPPKIAFVYFNVKNDGGWVQALDEARLKVEAETGQKIPYVENVPEVASAIRPAVETFIKRGYNIIVGSAFGYSDTFKALAEENPKVAFLNPAGTTNGPNLQSFYGRTYQSQYLCGMAAGGTSKSGKLGFVAAHKIGLVDWTINAYALGAQKVNPAATVTVVFTGSWNDPVKERAAADALIEQGIDVIGQHVDTPAVQLVAQEKGVHSTGHHRDMTEFAPDATICSSVWVWERYLVPTIKEIEAGTWEPSAYGDFPGIEQGGTDIKCCGAAVPKKVVDEVMAERQALIDGAQIFKGPIDDNSGAVKIPAGEVPSDADLWGMDWFVKGVIAQQ